MAISWGPWSSNNRLRAGVELTMSPTSVGSGTSSATITAKLYMQTRYASNESGSGATPWSFSGGFTPSSGSAGGWNLGAMGTKLLATATRTVATSYSSTVAVSTTAAFTSSFAYPGTKASVSASITVPKRPISAPATPTGLTVARVSDTQQNLSWSNTSPTNAAAPYQNVIVERWDHVSNVWATVATLGVVTSFQDKSTRADRSYQYRVRARNSAGYSPTAAYSSAWKTTPAAPSTPAAKKSGADILVSWSTVTPVADQVEVWHAANGVWDGARLALLSGSARSFTHVTPSPSVTHTYRLRAVTASPSLFGAYSGSSNVVQLLAAPNAPTGLAPSGTAVDGDLPITLSWQHNPVDTTDQTRFEVQWRVDGGAWVGTGTVRSDDSTMAVPEGTFGNGSAVEWQVRTWGDHPDPSAWSPVAVFNTSATPTVNINTPTDVDPVTGSRVTVEWGYFQAEGSPQAQWKAALYDAGGALLQTLAGSGDASSVTFTKPVLDGLTYTVTVQARSAAGVWSTVVSQTFPVDYAEPPTPVVEAYWLPDDGAVVLTVQEPNPSSEEQPAAVTLQVFRAIEGDEWRLIADGLEPSSEGIAVTDYVPPLGRLVTYKAIATSDLPSAAESVPVEVLTSGARFVFVNGGQGFSQSVRLNTGVSVDISSGRSKGVHSFAGGRRVEWAGDSRSRVVSVKADLFAQWAGSVRAHESSTWEDIEGLADLPGPHCFRDPDGRRFFVSMSDASVSGLRGPSHGTGFTLTEIDWTEPLGEG